MFLFIPDNLSSALFLIAFGLPPPFKHPPNSPLFFNDGQDMPSTKSILPSNSPWSINYSIFLQSTPPDTLIILNI